MKHHYKNSDILLLKKTNSRILSLDVFRGITIFLMIIVNTPGSWKFVYDPIKHSLWHGCTLADLVFPSFIFIIGLSLSVVNKKSNNYLIITNILKRSLLIFFIGVLLNWFPFNINVDQVRIFGVLQRIALAYFLSTLLIKVLNKTNYIIISSVFLLLFHWGVLYIFGESDPYSLRGNISNNFDLFFISENHMYKGFGVAFEPEGILGTLSSTAQVLIGYSFGRYLFSYNKNYKKNLFNIILLGFLFVIFGLIWNIYYPINKPIWTGSFVLYSSGIFLIFYSIISWIIDVKEIKLWSYVFEVFGTNSLISYIISIIFLKLFLYKKFIGGTSLKNYLFDYMILFMSNEYFTSLLFSIIFTFFIWTFAFLLYKKKIIIKL